MFKTLIEESFLNTVKVFVSSESDSIALGERWLENITNGLQNCVAMLVLCSPQSVGRPWINFEAGAGWTRGIDVVPICHSGMSPNTLPIPLQLLHGMQATDKKKLQEVFELVADKLGSSVPKVNVDARSKDIEVFEKAYVFEHGIGKALGIVGLKYMRILEAIGEATAGEITEVPISLQVYDALEPALEAVEKLEGSVQFGFIETQMLMSDGPRGRIIRNGIVEFTPSTKLIEAAQEVLAAGNRQSRQ